MLYFHNSETNQARTTEIQQVIYISFQVNFKIMTIVLMVLLLCPCVSLFGLTSSRAFYNHVKDSFLCTAFNTKSRYHDHLLSSECTIVYDWCLFTFVKLWSFMECTKVNFIHSYYHMFKYDVIAEKCFHSEVFCEDINLL